MTGEPLTDLEREVRRIAGFLGIAIDESQLPGILERCSFAWMKANADQVGEPLLVVEPTERVGRPPAEDGAAGAHRAEDPGPGTPWARAGEANSSPATASAIPTQLTSGRWEVTSAELSTW